MLEASSTSPRGGARRHRRDRRGRAARRSLDVHTDPDHHRSVFTIASTRAGDHRGRGRAGSPRSRPRTSICATTTGCIPRLGVVDVVPFVALAPTPRRRRGRRRPRLREPGSRASSRCRCSSTTSPTTRRRTLPPVRRDAFTPALAGPRAGGAAPDARRDRGRRAPPARRGERRARGRRPRRSRVASRARSASATAGSLGVRALGLALPSRRPGAGEHEPRRPRRDRDRARVHRGARPRRGAAVAVAGVELVGLLPAAALARASSEFLAWSGLGPSDDRRSSRATGAATLRRATPRRARPRTRRPDRHTGRETRRTAA